MALFAKEYSEGRIYDHQSRQQSWEDQNPPRTPAKGNGYCLQTGGGEREEAAVEKGRRRAKDPKKAASFRKHSFD